MSYIRAAAPKIYSHDLAVELIFTQPYSRIGNLISSRA